MKTFFDELTRFIDKIKNGEPFSLVRFHDGENYILRQVAIDITNKGNGEFKYDPEDTFYDTYRMKLIDSLQYKNLTYYVGIMSGCCVKAGIEGQIWMKEFSCQDEDHMTFATLFFNSNYGRVKDVLIPLLKERDVILVCNEHANLNTLPFDAIRVFTVSKNAWVSNHDLINNLQSLIRTQKINNTIFLFCAGPFSNILIHQLSTYWHGKDNTFINLGSVLDSYMFPEPTRWYQTNKNGHGEHTCIWK